MQDYKLMHAEVEVAERGYRCVNAQLDNSVLSHVSVEGLAQTAKKRRPHWSDEQAKADAQARYNAIRREVETRVLTTIDFPKSLRQRTKELYQYRWRALEPSIPIKRKNPMQEPYLFKVFARMVHAEDFEDACIHFANEWGFLGKPREASELDGEHIVRPIEGEAVTLWRDEAAVIAQVVELLRLAKQENEPWQLKSWFRWQDGRVYFTKGAKKQYVAHYVPEASVTEPLIELRDARAAAQRHVHNLVNAHVKGQTAARCEWNPTEGGYETHVTFTSLLGALWLQCLNELTGEVDWAQCPQCGTWFQRSGENGRRTNAKLCGNPKCKQQRYYVGKGKETRKRRYAAEKAMKTAQAA